MCAWVPRMYTEQKVQKVKSMNIFFQSVDINGCVESQHGDVGSETFICTASLEQVQGDLFHSCWTDSIRETREDWVGERWALRGTPTDWAFLLEGKVSSTVAQGRWPTPSPVFAPIIEILLSDLTSQVLFPNKD